MPSRHPAGGKGDRPPTQIIALPASYSVSVDVVPPGVVKVGLVIASSLVLVVAAVLSSTGTRETPRGTFLGGAEPYDPGEMGGITPGSLSGAEQYDPAFRELWIRGCVTGESVAFCRCAMDRYANQLRPDEFETASAIAQVDAQISELPEHIREVVTEVERDCR